MKTSRPSFSAHGGVVRVLVIVLGTAALFALGYIAILPRVEQAEAMKYFLLIAGAAAFTIFVIWRDSIKQPEPCSEFWLSQDGESDPCGPYTVAQIVAMWKAGQITTRGKVMAENGNVWLPIMTFADQFDASLPASNVEAPSLLHRLVRAVGVAIVGLVVLVFVVGNLAPPSQRPSTERASHVGEARTLGQQLRDLENSARGQQLKAEAAAEYEAEQRAKAKLEGKVKEALEMARR